MIDHYKLIDILAERLKSDIKTVGADLLSFLEDFHRSLKEHGRTDIPGLGTFRLAGNTIEFEADTQLLIDVNFRYHGFNEIVLESASEQEGQSVSYDETIPESAVFVIDEHDTIASPEVLPYEESGNAGPSLAETFISEKTDTLAAETELAGHEPELDTESDLAIVADSPLESTPVEQPDLDPEITHEKVDALHTPIQIKIRDGYTRSYDHAKHRIAAAFFIIAFVGGGLYTWYDGWFNTIGVPTFASTFPKLASNDDRDLITSHSPIIEIIVPPANLGAVNDSTQIDSIGVTSEQEADTIPSADNKYGLMGQFDTTITDFHTIVSGTFFTERVASQALDSVSTLGWRARLNRVRVSGSPSWELHIGQFQTREDGREANRSIDRMFQSEVIRRYAQQ